MEVTVTQQHLWRDNDMIGICIPKGADKNLDDKLDIVGGCETEIVFAQKFGLKTLISFLGKIVHCS